VAKDSFNQEKDRAAPFFLIGWQKNEVFLDLDLCGSVE